LRERYVEKTFGTEGQIAIRNIDARKLAHSPTSKLAPIRLQSTAAYVRPFVSPNFSCLWHQSGEPAKASNWGWGVGD